MASSTTITIFCLIACLASAKYYPKQFDLSLLPEARNCQMTSLSEGICAGGNWAHVFAQGLYLSHCVKSMQPLDALSSEQLLQCMPTFGVDRCTETLPNIELVDHVNTHLHTIGLAKQSCLPYDSFLIAHLKTPSCPQTCKDGSPLQSFKGRIRKVSTIEEVKDQLGSNGPAIIAISCSFFTFIELDKMSLNQYTSGEYEAWLDDQDKEDEVEFGVRFLLVTGWKTNAKGETIWKAQNTFGPQWATFGIVDLPHNHAYILTHYVVDVE